MSSNLMGFPFHSSGDLVIIISNTCSFKLHSGLLRRDSQLMKQLIPDKAACTLRNQALRQGVTTRYALLLSLVESNTKHRLLQVELDVDGDPIEAIEPLVEGETIVTAVQEAWYFVLASFYRLDTDIAALQDVKSLDSDACYTDEFYYVRCIAEYLDCVDLITEPCIAALRKTGALQKQIAQHPIQYLHFSSQIRSSKVYREALIQSAGQFNQESVQKVYKETELHAEVERVLLEKVRVLRTAVQDVEAAILNYAPPSLTRQPSSTHADRDQTSAASYGNDVLGWMALSVFRQWITQVQRQNRTAHGPDMGFKFCTVLARGGDAYLARGRLGGLLQRFPMSARAMRTVEGKVEELKEVAGRLATPLLVDNSWLRAVKKASFFTSTQVSFPADYPWVKESSASEGLEEPMSEAEMACGVEEGGEEELESDFGAPESLRSSQIFGEV